MNLKIYFLKKGGKHGGILIHLACTDNRDRGYKTSFMINSAEHEILNAHSIQIPRN